MMFTGYFRSIEQDTAKEGNLYRVQFKRLPEYPEEEVEELILGSSPFRVRYKREMKENNPFGLITSTATIRIVSEDCRKIFSVENTPENPVIVVLSKSKTGAKTILEEDWLVEWKGVLSDNNFNSGWNNPLDEFEVNADCFLSSPKIYFRYNPDELPEKTSSFSLSQIWDFLEKYDINDMVFPQNRTLSIVNSNILQAEGYWGASFGEIMSELAVVNNCLCFFEKGKLVFTDPVCLANTDFADEVEYNSGVPSFRYNPRKRIYLPGEYFDSNLTYSDSEGVELTAELTGELNHDLIEAVNDPAAYDLRDSTVKPLGDARGGTDGFTMLMDNGSGNSADGIKKYAEDGTYDVEHEYFHGKRSIPRIVLYEPDNEEGYQWEEQAYFVSRPLGYTYNYGSYDPEIHHLDPQDYCKYGGLGVINYYNSLIDEKAVQEGRTSGLDGVSKRWMLPSMKYPGKQLSRGIIQRRHKYCGDLDVEIFSDTRPNLFIPKGCLVNLDASVRCSLSTADISGKSPAYLDDLMLSLPGDVNSNFYRDYSIDKSIDPVHRGELPHPYIICPVELKYSNGGEWFNFRSGDLVRTETYLNFYYEPGIFFPGTEDALFGNASFSCFGTNTTLGEYEFLDRGGKEYRCLVPYDQFYNNLDGSSADNGLVGKWMFKFTNPFFEMTKLYLTMPVPGMKLRVVVDSYLYDSMMVQTVGESGNIYFKLKDGNVDHKNKKTQIKLQNLHYTDTKMNPINQVIYTSGQKFNYQSIQHSLGYGGYENFQDLQTFYYLTNYFSPKRIEQHSFWVCDKVWPGDLIKIEGKEKGEYIPGEPGDDAAALYHNFLGGWRTPLSTEWMELINNTTQKVVSKTAPSGETVEGFEFTGKGELESVKMFLPFTGRKYEDYWFDPDFEADYWCADKDPAILKVSTAFQIQGDPYTDLGIISNLRDSGRAVRAVSSDRKASGVDFGLPSGNIWEVKNIGAETETDRGSFFAWGETEEKDYYGDSNYKYYSTEKHEYTKYVSQGEYADGKSVLDIGFPGEDKPEEMDFLEGVYSIKEIEVDYEYEHSSLTTIKEPDMNQPNLNIQDFTAQKEVVVDNEGFERILEDKEFSLALESPDYVDMVIGLEYGTDNELFLKTRELTEEEEKTNYNNIYQYLFFDVYDVKSGDLILDLPFQLTEESKNPGFKIEDGCLVIDNLYYAL